MSRSGSPKRPDAPRRVCSNVISCVPPPAPLPYVTRPLVSFLAKPFSKRLHVVRAAAQN